MDAVWSRLRQILSKLLLLYFTISAFEVAVAFPSYFGSKIEGNTNTFYMLQSSFSEGYYLTRPVSPRPSPSRSFQTTCGHTEKGGTWRKDDCLLSRTRRQTIRQIGHLASIFWGGLSLGLPVDSVLAEVEVTTELSAKEIMSRLAIIPTFALVDGNSGVPFMIFTGQDACIGYFFLSYNMVEQALRDAKEKDKDKGASNIWNAAQIRVVPLSIALQLALTSRQRTAVNPDKAVQGIKLNTFADIVVSEEGNIDAKRLDGERSNNPSKWSNTKGRVPLFYVDGMTLANGTIPWYLNVADLKAAWKKQQEARGNDNVILSNDKIKITEMMDFFRTSARKSDWSALENVSIMPVKESRQVALQVVKQTPPEASPYSFDKVLLVSSSK